MPLSLHLSSGLVIRNVTDYSDDCKSTKWIYFSDGEGNEWAVKPEHIIASVVTK